LEGHIERCDEDVFKRADGSQDWVRWEVRPWENAQQTTGGLIISCEVITHLKRAQRELHFERNLAAALFSTHSAPIMVIDLKGRILRANPAATQLIPTQQLPAQDTPYWNQLLSDQQRDAAAFFFSSLDNEDNRTAEVPATTHETLNLETGEANVTWLNIPQRHTDGSIEAIVRIGAPQNLEPTITDPAEPIPAPPSAEPTHDPDEPLPAAVDPTLPTLDDLPDPVWRCDVRGRLEYVNRAWIDTRRLVGRDEIANEYGKGWLGAFHERDRRHIANKISEAINTRTPFSLEARILRLGETDLPVMLRGKPAYDIDDHFLGLVGTATDFSEKALIEETLHTLRKEATAPKKPQPAPAPAAPQPSAKPPTDSPESAAALAIAGAIPCGLLLIDPTGELLYANSLHVDITGADARNFPSIEDWLADRCTDSTHTTAVIDSWRDKVWRKQVRRTLPLVTADDILKEIEFRPTLLDDGRLLVVINDVTETHRSQEALRASESRLRALVREAGIPFAATDKTGDISTASTAFEHLLGYSSLQLRRLNFDDCLHEDDVAIKDEILRHLHESSNADTQKHFPVRLRTKSGETIEAKLHANAIHDDRGRPILTAFFVHPVEPAADHEQPPSPSTSKDDAPEPSPAPQASEDPSTSDHRTRNDLQLIFSLLNLQRTLTSDPSARAAITAGQARVRTINTIHQQISDTPAGTGSIDLSRFVTDLSKQLLDSDSDNLADRIETHLELDGVNLPLSQAASLGLVINELLSNAYHHAFPEGIAGTVHISASSDPFTGQLCLAIKDDGVGLPHGFAIGTTPGLGLQIVEALTEQLDGRLDIANDDETEFRVTVPISG
ncbi:MAG: PAS domain S-box protein, partial [Verrucomicrobiales bacterium]|nr:PAS domain S-box protein [Verrucomicrobiales bacterium]